MDENLRLLSRFFGRCTIIGFAVVIIWFAMYMWPADAMCRMSENMFKIGISECNMFNFAGIALLKILVHVLFLYPWIAIQLELRRRSKA